MLCCTFVYCLFLWFFCMPFCFMWMFCFIYVASWKCYFLAVFALLTSIWGSSIGVISFNKWNSFCHPWSIYEFNLVSFLLFAAVVSWKFHSVCVDSLKLHVTFFTFFNFLNFHWKRFRIHILQFTVSPKLPTFANVVCEVMFSMGSQWNLLGSS